MEWRIIFGMLVLLILGAACGLHCQPVADTTDRVAAARDSIGSKLAAALRAKGLHPGAEVFVRVFKREKQLEVWMRRDSAYVLFKRYAVCKMSGDPGPKRRQGDRQVPEGVYFIDRFNPKSKYHLSLGLNYPNEADLYFADKDNPGGEIFIHGRCASIGCVAIRDRNIEEVYLLALDAREHGQARIPVHIFPCRMTEPDNRIFLSLYPQHRALWESLREVFSYFERTGRVPEVGVTAQGTYRLIAGEK